MRTVTTKRCGELETWCWIEGALVRLSDVHEYGQNRCSEKSRMGHTKLFVIRELQRMKRMNLFRYPLHPRGIRPSRSGPPVSVHRVPRRGRLWAWLLERFR